MLFNDLPDDCLSEIFDKLFCLEDLVQLSKVCIRWENLILRRLRRVKYMIVPGYDEVASESDSPPQLLSHTVQEKSLSYLHVREASALLDLDLGYLVPNLKIFDFLATTHENGYLVAHERTILDHADIMSLVRRTTSCKGIVLPDPCDFPDTSFGLETPLDVEMVALLDISYSEYESIIVPEKLTQASVVATDLKSLTKINLHSNLKRLHLEAQYGITDLYAGPIFPKLKILEFIHNPQVKPTGNYFESGYRFMNFCPNLESAYLSIDLTKCPPGIDEATKNLNLKDLVLSFGTCKEYTDANGRRWFDSNVNQFPSLKSFLSMFPNLENLAIRGNREINDGNIKELIEFLPRIRLMDFRRSPGVTEKSDQYLAKYCQKRRRQPITFYYKRENEPPFWPKILSDQQKFITVVNGFDFMRFCFFADPNIIPLLLDF